MLTAKSENKGKDKFNNMTPTTINTTWLYDYCPVSSHKSVTDEQQNVRQLVWDFKGGWNTIAVAREITKAIQEEMTELSDYVFVCIPASSSTIHERRFGWFCDLVCLWTGMENGNKHLSITGTRIAKHSGKTYSDEDSRVYSILVERGWWRGKKVICFDDVITRGKSLRIFSELMKGAGAEVLHGFFLAKTKH